LSKLRLISAVLVAASLAVGTTAAFAGTKTIKIGDNWFISSSKNGTTVKVSKNAKIKWDFTGDEAHEVKLKSAPDGVTKSKFKVSERTSGTKTSPKLTRVGTYKFYCPIHDYDSQKVTVKVKAP
jgi:plastocyanin